MTGEEKLEKVFQYINRKADFGNTLSVGNARRAARFAFNAGRESVVENMPELKWECSWKYYFAATPLGCYSTNSFDADMLFYNGIRIPAPIGNVESNFEYVKQAADKDYKKQIKRALGI